jgi:ribosomal protein S18 acetylase RimI-like enzyme
MVALANSLDRTLYLRAEKRDASEILALQKIAYQTEAELYGDESVPALQQTLHELENDFHAPVPPAESVFLKAVVNGKIIGSVRGWAENGTAHINRLIVHPYFQRRGIGRRLMLEVEQAFPQAKRFELFTGGRSERSLREFRKLGYAEFKTEVQSPALTWVYLQKERS